MVLLLQLSVLMGCIWVVYKGRTFDLKPYKPFITPYMIAFLLPIGLYLYHLLESKVRFNSKRQVLFTEHGPYHFELRYSVFIADRLAVGFMVILITTAFSLLLHFTQTEGLPMMYKMPFDAGTQTIQLAYDMKHLEDLGDYQGHLSMTLPKQAPTDAEAVQHLKQIIKEVEAKFCANEYGPFETYSNLYCPRSLLGVNIAWTSTDAAVLLPNGHIRHSGIDKITPVQLKGVFTYAGQRIENTYDIMLHPLPLTHSQQHTHEQMRLAILEASASQNHLVLPHSIGDYQIQWKNRRPWMDGSKLFVLGGLIALAFYVLRTKSYEGHMKKRQVSIGLLLPNLINQLSLLIQAGMSFQTAWMKIIEDYEQQKALKGIRYELYEEMIMTKNDMANGTQELVAYEALAKRVGSQEMYRFISIVTQNIKKGNHMLTHALMQLGYEAWQNREKKAKIKGEQMNVKMLMPMLLVLIVLLMILMTPAVLHMAQF